MDTPLPKVAIIELGSQYTLLIERSLREMGVRSVILEPKRAADWLARHPVSAVILSGGAHSVYDPKAPQPPADVLSLTKDCGTPVPVLGICFGMQWMAARLGGEVRPEPAHKEYGPAQIDLVAGAPEQFFDQTPVRQSVWMSHGDSVVRVPEGFIPLAQSGSGAIAAMTNGVHWAVQFHPEVKHTPNGQVMLANFIFRIACCVTDWKPFELIADVREKTLRDLGGRSCIFGFSGGVDSTTLAAILSPAIGDRLHAVTIDGGHLREGELDEIHDNAAAAGVALTVVDARRQFEAVLAPTTDAEEKRARFKLVYVSLFIEAARRLGATAVLQGTLAPDRIESGATGGALIKSHHNVGLDMGELVQLHPIDHLFKYEVRALGKKLKLPPRVWSRQPFPGPGLFMRTVGVPATQANVEVTRWADARVRQVLEKHGLYEKLSQLVVAYLGVNTVGVKGDERVYSGAVVVRAVQTTDFMTATGVHFDEAVEDEIQSALISHPRIVRVWFDPTDKPPATTEME